jgi:hypothetical protein
MEKTGKEMIGALPGCCRVTILFFEGRLTGQ